MGLERREKPLNPPKRKKMILPKKGLFFALLYHRFSSSSTVITTRRGRKKPFLYVRSLHRTKFIDEAQKSIRNYLHQISSLPFVYAEQIAVNSPFSLSNFLRKIHFSAPTFVADIKKAFRYEPIHEFEFFFESIGIDREDVPRFLPPKTFFFSEDSAVLDAASELFRFGFPWNKLGKIYVEDVSIFRKSPAELERRLCALKERFGSDNLSVVGVCLAFPRLLSVAEGELGGGDEMARTLKWVFAELDGAESGVEGNVDAWYETCCKVRFFYDQGCEKAMVEEFLREKKDEFFKCPIDALLQKFDYFTKFDAPEAEVGAFLLQNLEITGLDLDTPAISVLGFLKHFGLDQDELWRVGRKYPYVIGRNEMANLPYVMKALDLHRWCFDRIKSSRGKLLATYSVGGPHDGADDRFVEAWKRIVSSRCVHHTRKKLDFLKGIGFGENDATMRTLNNLQGKGAELNEKFKFFLRRGIKHSDACYMVRRTPLMLGQSREKLQSKTDYCLHEMGFSVDFVVNYPDFYTLDLEFRLKPRHRFYLWLQAGGWRPQFSMAGMLQISEKRFMRRLYRIHPAAPKHYLERF